MSTLEDSLVVTYNDWRGEPRTHGAKRAEAAGAPIGDGIDCDACVQVCPTGVDIRKGQQIGCITCALCIDACDDIMTKLGRERGLISYATLRDYDANMALASDPASGAIDPSRIRGEGGGFVPAIKHFDWRIFLRPRTLLYAALWAAIGLGLLFALNQRDRLEINVQHDRNPVWVVLKDGSIRNGYTVKLLNMIPEERVMTLSLEGLPDATMRINGFGDEGARVFDVPAPPDQALALRVFVTMPEDALVPGSASFAFIAEDAPANERDRYDAQFEAPAE